MVTHMLTKDERYMTTAKFLVEQGVTALKALRRDGRTILVCSIGSSEHHAVHNLSGSALVLYDTITSVQYTVMLPEYAQDVVYRLLWLYARYNNQDAHRYSSVLHTVLQVNWDEVNWDEVYTCGIRISGEARALLREAFAYCKKHSDAPEAQGTRRDERNALRAKLRNLLIVEGIL